MWFILSKEIVATISWTFLYQMAVPTFETLFGFLGSGQSMKNSIIWILSKFLCNLKCDSFDVWKNAARNGMAF